ARPPRRRRLLHRDPLLGGGRDPQGRPAAVPRSRRAGSRRALRAGGKTLRGGVTGDSLHGAQILVLGGLGFIGSNLTAALHARGARVTVLTPSRERHEALARTFDAQAVQVVEGDIRDQGLMLD